MRERACAHRPSSLWLSVKRGGIIWRAAVQLCSDCSVSRCLLFFRARLRERCDVNINDVARISALIFTAFTYLRGKNASVFFLYRAVCSLIRRCWHHSVCSVDARIVFLRMLRCCFDAALFSMNKRCESMSEAFLYDAVPLFILMFLFLKLLYNLDGVYR